MQGAQARAIAAREADTKQLADIQQRYAALVSETQQKAASQRKAQTAKPAWSGRRPQTVISETPPRFCTH